MELVSQAQHPNTPPEVLAELVAVASERAKHDLAAAYRLRMALAQNPNTPSEALVRLIKPAEDPYGSSEGHGTAESFSWRLSCLEALARNPNLPPSAIGALSRGSPFSTSAPIVSALYENPAWPLWILADVGLASIPDEALRPLLGKQCPTFLLEAIAQHPSVYLRSEVAKQAHTPPHMLRILARDVLVVALAVAQNEALPEDAREYLLSQGEEKARASLARNRSLRTEHAERLARDESSAVRAAIADHAALSGESLLGLSRDALYSVRLCAARNGNLPAERIVEMSKEAHGEKAMLGALARNRNAPASFLATLPARADRGLWTAAAEHPNTPSEALDWLSRKSGDTVVLSRVVVHPNTPENTLRRLSGEPTLALQMLGNPKLSRALLTRLAVHPNPQVRHKAQEKLSKERVP